MRRSLTIGQCLLLGLIMLGLAVTASATLNTSGRWIVDSNNKRVKLRCVNWAGHMETHVPEGLQHQKIDEITSWISANDFNCVRLTYSVDMALNSGLSVAEAFDAAAEPAGVTKEALQSVYSQIQQKNPFVNNSTVLGVYENIISSLAQQNLMVILDNHVSRASWCCSQQDGNGWWSAASGYSSDNSRFFDADLWVTSLQNMASMAASHSNVVGMSIRNELRPTGDQNGNSATDWYTYVAEGSSAIHNANSNLLIIIGGINYATDSSFLFANPFNQSAYSAKVVWEFHSYTWSYKSGISTDCDSLSKTIGDSVGFLLTENQPYTGPLFLSEFGVDQGLGSDDRMFLGCLVDYMTSNDADWAVWALQGSYYVRDGQIDMSEPFGLLSNDWSGWRNPEFKTLLGSMWNITQGV